MRVVKHSISEESRVSDIARPNSPPQTLEEPSAFHSKRVQVVLCLMQETLTGYAGPPVRESNPKQLNLNSGRPRSYRSHYRVHMLCRVDGERLSHLTKEDEVEKHAQTTGE